ncbi:MAG: FKBP-type peptidyl-prolyl cis-trans isomerase [Methylococcales bacterium]|nr:FKBP-type peptidyl-prolyl cis-trans isomerase [Methylococcales bacterium]MBT7444900.1 FKBP-type peptidyl-prolyl cis-trans isomerase [Methylococcales bacterium]
MADGHLANEQQKLSYSFGQQLGALLKQQGAQLDIKLVQQGLSDAVTGKPAQLTLEEMQTVLLNFKASQQKKREEKNSSTANNNKQEGADFLAKNKQAAGVISLPSGLQYQVIKAGKGQSPSATSKVTTHYRGTLINGTEFDSSYSRGQPLSFKVNGVIKGWTEALQLMKPGAKWKLFVPYDLAYGARGAGGKIGPYSTLIFEVELISFK